MSRPAQEDKNVCQNRKARFRFEILETLECGIELLGSEVKSLRERAASIEEAYARIDRDELWLIGANIPAYAHAPAQQHDPDRKRRLLAHKSEIRKLKPKVDLRGLTLIPLRLYFNDRGIAKVAIGVAKGKTLGDKRESMKAREHKREIDRAVRGRR